MWHTCVVMGQSNQVRQLIKIASEDNAYKNSQFCEDMLKSKNAIRVTLVIYF